MIMLATTAKTAVAQQYPVDPGHVTSGAQVEALNYPALGAAGTVPRSLVRVALNLIKDFEAWVPTAYNDASQYCTLGYGHLIALKPCESSQTELSKFTIPLAEADGLALLDTDTTKVRTRIRKLVKVDLNDEQFGALTSFVFNIGDGNFETSTLLAYLNEGNYKAAEKQFGRWIVSKKQVLNGLISRRACEAALFGGRLEYEADNVFGRASCSSLGAAPSGMTLIDIESGENK
jgi:lysozyme